MLNGMDEMLGVQDLLVTSQAYMNIQLQQECLSCPGFLKECILATLRSDAGVTVDHSVGVPASTPYQMQHGGPSWDES